MRNKLLFVIGGLLFILGQIGVNFLIYKYKNKNTDISRVQLRDVEENKKDKKKSFAIMLEQDDGSYKTTSSNSFDHPGYVFNSRKSKCVDDYGNVVENILNYDNDTKMMGVKTSKTAYCHVYFDKLKNLYEACGSNNMSSCESSGKLISVESLWQSGLEGDGYRYVGTNPNNYICFGTTNKSTCTGNTDAYMYRIIGIFADNSGNQYLKLIKKEALNTAYGWNSNYTSNVPWNNSDLYKGLNGSYFLSNTTYVPNDTWKNKIATTNWKYGDVKNVNVSASSLYSTENGWASNIAAKIGLMYAHEYAYGLKGGNNCSGLGAYSICKTGWMHLSNNDSGAPNTAEWTISRGGNNADGTYYAWRVGSVGDFNNNRSLNQEHSVRPVFFLNNTEVIKSGKGTLSDPYILK